MQSTQFGTDSPSLEMLEARFSVIQPVSILTVSLRQRVPSSLYFTIISCVVISDEQALAVYRVRHSPLPCAITINLTPSSPPFPTPRKNDMCVAT